MTYNQLIGLVNDQLRDQEAWPFPASATADQLRRCYVAVVAVSMTVPLQRLELSVANLAPSSPVIGVYTSPLPANLFTLRPDLGISHFKFDGIRRYIRDQVDLGVVNAAAENEFQSGNKLFHLIAESKQIVHTEVSQAQVVHAPMPSEPSTGASTFELQPTDIESVIQIVVAHVSGVTIKNPAAAQFAILLKQMYDGRVDANE